MMAVLMKLFITKRMYLFENTKRKELLLDIGPLKLQLTKVNKREGLDKFRGWEKHVKLKAPPPLY